MIPHIRKTGKLIEFKPKINRTEKEEKEK